MRRTFVGIAAVTGPRRSVTSCPARRGAGERGAHLPLLRLPMNRTGSIGSYVGPAVIRMRMREAPE